MYRPLCKILYIYLYIYILHNLMIVLGDTVVLNIWKIKCKEMGNLPKSST